MAQIFIFGDSIAYGAWDSKGGWAGRLRSHLDQKEPKKHYVYNLSIPTDETSDEVLTRIDNELGVRQGSKKENVILIAIGVNDSEVMLEKNEQKTPVDKFKSNISEMINVSKNYAGKIILVGVLPFNQDVLDPIPWVPQRAYRKDKAEEYDKNIKQLCEENSVHYIYMYDLDIIDTLDDGIHPNDDGHALIFKRIKRYLEENIL